LACWQKIYLQARSQTDFTDLNAEDAAAIEQAIESAERMGMPVSVAKLRSGESIGTLTAN
jgi:hypothetical protein